MLIVNKAKVSRRSSLFRLLAAVITVLFTCSVTVTAFAVSTQMLYVTVTDGLCTKSFLTQSTEPEQIVHESEILYNANDLLITDGFDPETGGLIVIERAKTIRIADSDKVIYCIGYGDTSLKNTLAERGVDVDEGELPDVDFDETVFDGMQVILQRAFPITVQADGETYKVFSTGATVAEILDELGIEPDEDDTVSRNLETQLNAEATVVVNRVQYRENIVEEPIAYETVTKVTADLYEGETEVETEGVAGTRIVNYKEKYVDGALTEREETESEILREPVDKIVLMGSKKRPALIEFADGISVMSKLDVPAYVTLGSNGLPTKYVDYMEGEATAYTGDPATSTGRVPMQGHVAVDPREIPYGTEMYIASLDGKYIYGYCIAADTGGFIYTSNTLIDLYMDTEDMCYEWGRRDIAVYILSYPE